MAARHPDVGKARIYIDAGSMMFATNPERYDVVVTENVFGDIASEIAAGVVGGLGVAPSADVSETHGVFQPSHGSAPDIAGKGAANPGATILSAAMMLDWLSDKHGDERSPTPPPPSARQPVRSSRRVRRPAISAARRALSRSPRPSGTR